MADQRSEIQNPKLRECANLLCDVTNLFLSDDDIHIKNTIISDKELVVGELESRMKDAREIIRGGFLGGISLFSLLNTSLSWLSFSLLLFVSSLNEGILLTYYCYLN